MNAATITAIGGGWYHVHRKGIRNPIRLARGRANAEQLRAEMNSETEQPTPDVFAVYARMIDANVAPPVS